MFVLKQPHVLVLKIYTSMASVLFTPISHGAPGASVNLVSTTAVDRRSNKWATRTSAVVFSFLPRLAGFSLII